MGLMQTTQATAAALSLSLAALGQTATSGTREAAQSQNGATSQIDTPPRADPTAFTFERKMNNGVSVDIGSRFLALADSADKQEVRSYLERFSKGGMVGAMGRAFDQRLVSAMVDEGKVPFLDTSGQPLTPDRSDTRGIDGTLSLEDSRIVRDAAAARGVHAVAIQWIDFHSGKIGLLELTDKGTQVNFLEVDPTGLAMRGGGSSYEAVETMVGRIHSAVVAHYQGSLTSPEAVSTESAAAPQAAVETAAPKTINKLIDPSIAPIEKATFSLKGAELGLYQNPRNTEEVRSGVRAQFSLRNGSNHRQTYTVDMFVRDEQGNEQQVFTGKRIPLDVKTRTKGPNGSDVVEIRSSGNTEINLEEGKAYTIILRCSDERGEKQLLAESAPLTASRRIGF